MGILLFLLFIVLPLAELYVIIQVGQAIGVWPTLALLLAGGFIGASLARSQGRLVWQRFNEAMAAGQVPAREVFEGAMVMFGGALLLSPGFLTDIVGIMLLIPPGRALVRGLVRRAAARTPSGRPIFFVYDRMGSRRSGGGPRGGTGPAPPRRAPSNPGPSRGYDYEGSAREIGDSEGSLPPGSEGEPER
jgi:UPF0716 protein FxsA